MATVHGANERRCNNCGAPTFPGLAACDYCRHAYPGASPGPRCVACDVVNVAGAMSCGKCRVPLSQSCLFCGRASPLDAASCRHCREAFAGAAARKAQREAAVRHKRYVELAGTGVQVAGAVITSGAAEGFLDAVSGLLKSLDD